MLQRTDTLANAKVKVRPLSLFYTLMLHLQRIFVRRRKLFTNANSQGADSALPEHVLCSECD